MKLYTEFSMIKRSNRNFVRRGILSFLFAMHKFLTQTLSLFLYCSFVRTILQCSLKNTQTSANFFFFLKQSKNLKQREIRLNFV